MTKEYLRVSELNQLIEDVIHAGFPQPLWICGEIQGFNRNRGKTHIFFELVEKDPNSKNIIAKIGLVLFAGRKAYIRDILGRSENAFSLKDDIEVKFACSIDFYPPHGAIRLIVESIDPIYTLGKLAQEKQKLIALLKKKGILDKNKQFGLPLVPLCVGFITADDSAAYNDFCSELKRSGFAFQLYLRNTLMQGKMAEGDVCKALGELSEPPGVFFARGAHPEERSDEGSHEILPRFARQDEGSNIRNNSPTPQLSKIEGLDCIVITRGGGSIADLSCFDSQMIAEKIAGCPLPVLSGIGHEINISITDMAAHTYAKTPTAVAQFLVSRVQVFLDDLEEKLEQIAEGAQGKIEDEQQRLKNYAVGLQNNTRSYLKGHSERIVRLQEIIRQRSVLLLKNHSRSLADIENTVKRVTGTCLNNSRVKLTGYRRMIDNFHPANTIKRGFSITRTKDGKAVKNVSSVHLKEDLITEVADGLITSEVGHITQK